MAGSVCHLVLLVAPGNLQAVALVIDPKVDCLSLFMLKFAVCTLLYHIAEPWNEKALNTT